VGIVIPPGLPTIPVIEEDLFYCCVVSVYSPFESGCTGSATIRFCCVPGTWLLYVLDYDCQNGVPVCGGWGTGAQHLEVITGPFVLEDDCNIWCDGSL
jgi:hypothetical protein